MADVIIGGVALCLAGRYGVVTKIRVSRNKTEYFGTGFDGKPWSSTKPIFVAESVDEFIRERRPKEESIDSKSM